jgi:hypothetical protein
VAQNLTKRLDRIERLIKERLSTNEGPVYLSEGEDAPDGRDAIRIVMQWVEAQQQEDEQLEDGQSLDALNSAPRKTSLAHPLSRRQPSARNVGANTSRRLMLVGRDIRAKALGLLCCGKASFRCSFRGPPNGLFQGWIISAQFLRFFRLRNRQRSNTSESIGTRALAPGLPLDLSRPLRGAFSFGGLMTDWRTERRMCRCGERFKPARQAQSFCSPQCRDAAKKQRKRSGDQKRGHGLHGLADRL